MARFPAVSKTFLKPPETTLRKRSVLQRTGSLSICWDLGLAKNVLRYVLVLGLDWG